MNLPFASSLMLHLTYIPFISNLASLNIWKNESAVKQFGACWATGMLFLETRLCEAEIMGSDLLLRFVSSSVLLKLLKLLEFMLACT